MSDWDEDGEQLRANLRRVLSHIREDAFRRTKPSVEAARRWQSDLMHGLSPPDPRYLGHFRGEPGLEDCEVAIGDRHGVSSNLVAAELKAFESKLEGAVDILDELIETGRELGADELAAVIDLCAWVHGEWVHIHPFANGNGRTARLWANSIAMRYGLPPFVRLRPRPDGGYVAASAAAMDGRWQEATRVFHRMLRETLRR